ncbi:MAG: hypothetical protein OQJ80_09400 [Kangiella sp.]|nr:hypothetical protein [Kangiella sp.]
MEYNFNNDSKDADEVRFSEDLGPELEECKIKIRRGFWTAVVVAVLTLIMAIVTNYENGLVAMLDSGYFYYVAACVLLAIGIYYKSRVSASLMLMYFVISKIIQINQTGKASGILLILIITVLLAQATLATFKYHRLRKQQNPEYQATSKLTWWLATPVNAILSLVLVTFLLVETGYWVPTSLMNEETLSVTHVETLRDSNIIGSNEKVDLFFSEGLTSILEGGNIVTDSRVISYESVDGELYVFSAKFSDVSFVGIEEKGTALSYSQIYVETYEGDSFYLLAPHEQKEDEQFVKMIRERAALAQSESNQG